jgi:hypothetical protein
MCNYIMESTVIMVYVDLIMHSVFVPHTEL